MLLARYPGIPEAGVGMTPPPIAALDVPVAEVQVQLPRRTVRRPSEYPDFMRGQPNESWFDCLMDYTSLPHPSVEVLADAVYVQVKDMDQLAHWVDDRYGYVEVSPPFAGLRTYVFHTATDVIYGEAVKVVVSTTVPVDGYVNYLVAEAVCDDR